MNPWLERVHRSTAASVASPLSLPRNNSLRSPQTPSVDSSRRMLRDSQNLYQTVQRLTTQLCDSHEREDVKRSILPDLVPMMLELCESSEFDPESFGVTLLSQFLQVAALRITQEVVAAVSINRRSSAPVSPHLSSLDWWSPQSACTGDWRFLVRRCAPVLDGDLHGDDRTAWIAAHGEPEPSCFGLLLCVRSLAAFPSLARHAAAAHAPSLMLRLLLLLAQRFSDPGSGPSDDGSQASKQEVLSTPPPASRYADGFEDIDEEHSFKPAGSQSSSTLSLSPTTAASSPANIEMDLLEQAGLLEWHCLAVLRLWSSQGSACAMDLVATDSLHAAFKLLMNLSLPAVVRSNLADVVLGLLASGPLVPQSAVSAPTMPTQSRTDLPSVKSSNQSAPPLPLELFAHLEARDIIPQLLTILRAPPAMSQQTPVSSQFAFTFSSTPTSTPSQLISPAASTPFPITPASASEAPAAPKSALPALPPMLKRAVTSPPTMLSPPSRFGSSSVSRMSTSELGSRLEAYHAGHATESVSASAAQVLDCVRVVVALLRESLRAGTGSLLAQFDHSQGSDGIGSALVWLAALHQHRSAVQQHSRSLKSDMSQSFEVDLDDAELQEIPELVSLLASLSFVGMQDLPVPKLDAGACPVPIELSGHRGAAPVSGSTIFCVPHSPYASISFPKSTKVRHRDAFRSLCDVFVRSPCVRTRALCIAAVRAILGAHPSNYALIADLKSIALMMQYLDQLPVSPVPADLSELILASGGVVHFELPASSDLTLDARSTSSSTGQLLELILFIVVHVRCVPFQELIALGNMLVSIENRSARESYATSMRLAFALVASLVDIDPVFQNILAAAGLLDVCINASIRLEMQLQTSALFSTHIARALASFNISSAAAEVELHSRQTEKPRERPGRILSPKFQSPPALMSDQGLKTPVSQEAKSAVVAFAEDSNVQLPALSRSSSLNINTDSETPVAATVFRSSTARMSISRSGHRRSNVLASSSQLRQMVTDALESAAGSEVQPVTPKMGSVLRRKSTNANRRMSLGPNSLPPLDLALVELVMSCIAKLLCRNRANQGIFMASEGQQVILGMLQHNALRESALQIIENIVESNAAQIQLHSNNDDYDNEKGGVALSYENYSDMKSLESSDFEQVEMLLAFLSAPRCHIFAKCQILRSLRRMCSTGLRAQLAFEEHQGFSKVLALFEKCSVSSLHTDSFVESRVELIEKQALLAAQSAEASNRELSDLSHFLSGASEFTTSQRDSVVHHLSQQYALLLVQEAFAAVSAAARKNKRNREVWARAPVFAQLLASLRQSGVLDIPSAPAFVSIWLIWLASEHVPSIDLHASEAAPTSTRHQAATQPAVAVPAEAAMQFATPFLGSLRPWLSFDGVMTLTDTQFGPNALPHQKSKSLSFKPLKLFDPSSLPLPAQGVFHNAAAVAVSVQVLQLVTAAPEPAVPAGRPMTQQLAPPSASSSVAFQLHVLRYIQRQAQNIPVNLSLLCAVDFVSSLVTAYRSLLLDSSFEQDHLEAVRQRRAYTVSSNQPPPPSGGNLDVNVAMWWNHASNAATALSASDHLQRDISERRALVLTLIRTCASFSCSGNDVRALVALLNAPHPRWQVALDLLIDAVQSTDGSAVTSSKVGNNAIPSVSATSIGPYVQFHLARRGLACLHLPLLSHSAERTWPPSSGYTFAAWMCVDSFGGDSDQATPLRLLSLASSDSKSLTDAYIIRRVLNLQTAANQRVEFSAFRFEPGRWYHVVISHAKHLITASTVRLFINGALVQTEKLAYISSSSAPVASWIGTPPQYQCVSRIQWRLASCLFVDDSMDDDSVSRLFASGPNIAGLVHSANQHFTVDVLDTYFSRAAASLDSMNATQSVRFQDIGSPKNSSLQVDLNHMMSAESDATSGAATVTSDPSVRLDRIVFALHAKNVMQASHLYPSLSVSSAGAAADMSDSERVRWGANVAGLSATRIDPHYVLLLNSGRPTVSHAIVRGDARVYDPVSLSDALRQIGGLRVLLPLFERNLTGEALRKSLILVQLLLRESPKTLREVDAIGAYSIIAHLLKKRQRVPLDATAFEMLTGMCGLSQSCTSGRIVAPAAFRALCLDHELWTRSPAHVQQLMFHGLMNCVRENPNAVRHRQQLRSMQTLPWLLGALADPSVSDDLIPHVVAVIKALLTGDDQVSSTDLQQVADFILTPACFESTAPSSGTNPSSPDSTSFPRPSSLSLSQRSSSPVNERQSLTVGTARLRFHSKRALLAKHLLLHMLLQLSLQTASTVLIAALTRVLDARWVLGVLECAPADRHPVGAVLSLRLIAALIQRSHTGSVLGTAGTFGDQYLDRLRSGGVLAGLSRVLMPYIGCGAVFHALFMLLFAASSDSISPNGLLPLHVRADSQDEHALELPEMLSAFEEMSQPLPEYLSVEHVRAATSVALAQQNALIPEILDVILGLIRASVTVTATSGAVAPLSSAVPPAMSGGPSSATVSSSMQPPSVSAPMSAPPTMSFGNRLESYFGSATPPATSTPAPVVVQVSQAQPAVPARGSGSFRERLGGLKVSIENPNSSMLQVPNLASSAASSPALPSPSLPRSSSASAAKFTLPPADTAIELKVVDTLYQLMCAHQPLRTHGSQISVLTTVAATVHDSVAALTNAALQHKRNGSNVSGRILLAPESIGDEEFAAPAAVRERSGTLAAAAAATLQSADLQSNSIQSLLPTFAAWLSASSVSASAAAISADSGVAPAVAASTSLSFSSFFGSKEKPAAEAEAVITDLDLAFKPLPAGGCGSDADAFRHPTALRLLDWAPHALWHQLCVHARNSTSAMEEAMSAVPQLNAPARPTHMIRILLGICSLLRAATRVDAADFLDSNPRMSLNRVVHCLVDQVALGSLARGGLVVMETLFVLIERLTGKWRFGSAVQQLFVELNRLILILLARTDLSAAHRVAINNALLQRQALLFGEHNKDRNFMEDLAFYLCTHLLLLPPDFASERQSVNVNSTSFALAPSTTAADFDLRNTAMQLLSGMLKYQLGVMAELLIANDEAPRQGAVSDGLGAFDMFTLGFDKLIGMEFAEFHSWLTRQSSLLRTVLLLRLAPRVNARLTVAQAERNSQLESQFVAAHQLFERRESEATEADSAHADLLRRLVARRARVRDSVGSLLLQGQQSRADRQYHVRATWRALRSELRHARAVSAPPPMGDPISNPEQVSLELLDVADAPMIPIPASLPDRAATLTVHGLGSGKTITSVYFNGIGSQAAQFFLLTAAHKRVAGVAHSMGESLLGRWSDRCLVGADLSSDGRGSHRMGHSPLYQRWHLEFIASSAGVRTRLERPTFHAADVLAWVRACQRPVAVTAGSDQKVDSPPSTPLAVQKSEQMSSSIDHSPNESPSLDRKITDTPLSPSDTAGLDPEAHLLESERLLLMLEPGDRIVYCGNCSRLVGADECRGVLLVCTRNLYLIDNFQIGADGSTVIDLTKQSGTSFSMAPVPRAAAAAAALQRPKVSSAPQSADANAVARAVNPFESAHEEGDMADEESDVDQNSEDVFGIARVDQHSCLCKALSDLMEAYPRRYLLQPTGVEISFSDGVNQLLVLEAGQRDRVVTLLQQRCRQNVADLVPPIDGSAGRGLLAEMLGTFQASRLSTTAGLAWQRRQAMDNKQLWLQQLTEAWQQGFVSNFDYLIHLNAVAGRTFNDLTQYPIFPWVLRDYESNHLDLFDVGPATGSNATAATAAATARSAAAAAAASAPDSESPGGHAWGGVFRDLSKPMGALTEPRAEQFRQRYNDWDDPSEQIPKFHYGTTPSSAAVVLYYLLRLEPFTQHVLLLQSGRFDRSDRLFHSVRESWLSASEKATADVKELIPEFYFLPEFLMNGNRLDLGWRQNGARVDDVVLPPWAHGCARYFVRQHRRALESAAVSARIHAWIDLTFGHQQRGPAAVSAQNVFYYLTYEGSVDVESISDPVMKAAAIEQIRSFGQTPSQLFTKPHPLRQRVAAVPDIFLQPNALTLRERRVIGFRVGHMVVSASANLASEQVRVLCAGAHQMLIPARDRAGSYHRVSWGFPDGTLRFAAASDDDNGGAAQPLLGVYKNMHDGPISRAAFSDDGATLATGGRDSVVCVWKRSARGRFEFISALSGLRGAISALAVSQQHSLLAAGAEDGSVFVWDLNRLVCVRRLDCFSSQPIVTLSFDAASGDLYVATAHVIYMFDVNLRRVLAHSLTDDPRASDAVTSLLVLDAPFDQCVEASACVLTGHEDGAFRIWHVVYAPLPADDANSDADDDGEYLDGDADTEPASVDATESNVEPESDSDAAVVSSSEAADDGEDADVDAAKTAAGALDEPVRPGAPPPGALEMEINRSRNANPLGFVWHLRLMHECMSETSSHRAPITALAASFDRHSMWVADADGHLSAWQVRPAPSEVANDTQPISFSALTVQPRARELTIPLEPSPDAPCSPCIACKKIKYKAGERRVLCVVCAGWVCADCQLNHIRDAHPL